MNKRDYSETSNVRLFQTVSTFYPENCMEPIHLQKFVSFVKLYVEPDRPDHYVFLSKVRPVNLESLSQILDKSFIHE